MWIYRIGVDPGVHTPVALEIRFKKSPGGLGEAQSGGRAGCLVLGVFGFAFEDVS